MGACHIAFPDGRHYEPPQYGVEKLGPLCLTISSAGGGGFGDPCTRSAERVREDVVDGLVSPRAATDDYGVVLGAAPDFAIDVRATERLRATKLPS
jgi:N-methylhydantoinase B